MPARILVVAAESGLLREYCRSAEAAGLDVRGARSFDEARHALAAGRPDLVAACVRLHEYNGVHLALIARQMSPPVPAIVLGYPDAALEAEALAAGAVYLEDPTPVRFLAALAQQLAPPPPGRRWERKRIVGGVRGRLGEAFVRLLDVSYGGFRVEVPRAAVSALEGAFELQLPEHGITADAWRVWIDADGHQGTCLCGAAVSPLARSAGSRWRLFVDSLGAPADTA